MARPLLPFPIMKYYGNFPRNHMRYLVPSLLLLLGASLLVFTIKLIRNRLRFRRLRQNGLPMPPHSFIFGHLLLCASIFRSLPTNAHPFYLGDQIRRRYPDLDTAFYIDLWPFNDSMLMVMSPQPMAQFTQRGYLPKHPGVRRFLEPLTGDHDIVTMEGQPWKHWRSVFNPGFSHLNVMSVVPQIVEEVLSFDRLILSKSLSENIIQLEKMTRNLSFDVIGRVAMNHKFSSQTQYNVLTSAMKEQIEWCSFGLDQSILQRINPFKYIVFMQNKLKINNYLVNCLRNIPSTYESSTSGKSIVELAVSALTSEGKEASPGEKLLENQLLCHIKTFLVAGHDTVSTSICFVLHLLYSHQDVLDETREEHDAVFGKDAAQAAQLVTSQPHLLSKLPITFSVIKESLRLYPGASTARSGRRNFEVIDEDGRSFPTEGLLVWGNHHGLHYNPRFWPEPEKFLPQRWRVAEGDPLYPPKDAWRPFEKGPRACLGQDLAMTEMAIVIVLLLRKYDITPAYSAWDSLLRKPGKGVSGQRVYQCLRGGAYPSDYYPCIITNRENI